MFISNYNFLQISRNGFVVEIENEIYYLLIRKARLLSLDQQESAHENHLMINQVTAGQMAQSQLFVGWLPETGWRSSTNDPPKKGLH